MLGLPQKLTLYGMKIVPRGSVINLDTFQGFDQLSVRQCRHRVTDSLYDGGHALFLILQ